MNAAERFVRALREAADAFEELQSGKAKQRRRRGPVPATDVPVISERAKMLAEAHLRKVGIR